MIRRRTAIKTLVLVLLQLQNKLVKDILHISTGLSGIKAVAVYDIYGKNCSSATTSHTGQNLEINMSVLKAGIYFIRLDMGNRIETIRVVKL